VTYPKCQSIALKCGLQLCICRLAKYVKELLPMQGLNATAGSAGRGEAGKEWTMNAWTAQTPTHHLAIIK